MGGLTDGMALASAPAPGKASLSSRSLSLDPDLDKARPAGPESGGATYSARPFPRSPDLGRRKLIKGESGPRLRAVGAGIEAEKRAARLPWMGRRPPADRGGDVGARRPLPRSTIQTDLARSPAAVGLSRVLLPSEDALMEAQRPSPNRPKAFIRLAYERCRAIILALPNSGNLCRADIISMTTFNALNKCAVRKLELEPCKNSSHIKSVTGSALKIDGKIKGGIIVELQGSAGKLHLNPLVSSNFHGDHLNLSQHTMSWLKIQLRPNHLNGGHFVTGSGQAPLVPRGGVYSLNYKSAFKRISIFRHKNGWLYQRLRGSPRHSVNKQTHHVGQLSLSDRRSLKALGIENSMLKETREFPLILTSDGFLQPHESNIPDTTPSPKLFDHDPFAAHEDLRGKSISELREYFEGPPNEDGSPAVTPLVSHISEIIPGQRAFLAPQKGRLKKDITLASGESATVVVTA